MLGTRTLKGFENMQQINIIYLSFHGRTCLTIVKLEKFHKNWRYSHHHWFKRHLVTRLTTMERRETSYRWLALFPMRYGYQKIPLKSENIPTNAKFNLENE